MKIFDYEEVVMNWDSFTYPIAVGTPVSVDGVLADNSSAHGLIARTVFAKPDGGDTLKIMTGGFIDMEEIVAGYGQELSSAAVQALCGIHFYKEGVCIPTGGSGGGDDSQKWKEETSTPLFNETATTVVESGNNVATLTYSTAINSDTLIVTFDGVEYACPKNFDGYGYWYGASYDESTDSMDFSNFPFQIYSVFDESTGNFRNMAITETAGEHTVVGVGENITYTPAFVDGVKKNSAFIVHFSLNNEGITADKTASEILQAYNNDYFVIGVYPSHSDYKEVYYLQDIYELTGGVSFVNYAVRFVDNAPALTLNYITSNSDDINTFTNGSKPIS